MSRIFKSGLSWEFWNDAALLLFLSVASFAAGFFVASVLIES